MSSGDFQGMLTDWINFNHGELQVRPTVENSLEKDVTTIQKMVVNLYKAKNILMNACIIQLYLNMNQ